jgi:hypothetical protein
VQHSGTITINGATPVINSLNVATNRSLTILGASPFPSFSITSSMIVNAGSTLTFGTGVTIRLGFAVTGTGTVALEGCTYAFPVLLGTPVISESRAVFLPILSL